MDALRERLRAVPGMERLLPLLAALPPVHLVGGAVRDLLLGEQAVDLDLAIEGDAVGAAQELADLLHGRSVRHERFGTATVTAPDGFSFDLAATRRETYPQPGALPKVAPASLEEDLARRDFAINAIAVGLSGDDLGHLRDPLDGVSDLEEGVLRVLHEGSFLDDPTRILRAARYESRLDFALDPDSEALAREAVKIGALGTVSSERVARELLRLLAETEAGKAVDRLGDLGVDQALHPELHAEGELVAAAELGALETGADRALAGLAALAVRSPSRLGDWIGTLGLDAGRREAAARAARTAPLLATELARPLRPSELRALLRREPPEALALALALGAPADPVLRWASDLRHTRLSITGEDLIEAGIAPGPAVGAALEETLRRTLDGDVEGREEQLDLALRVAREGS
jgi:tRNA nucleotidyltransferase (CCA-adding enzyme)